MILTIAHLYPDLLNMYGDRGNIITIKQRTAWRDIKCQVVNIGLEDNIDPDKYDFYFIGGGQDQQQIAVAKRLQNVAPQLREAAEAGAVFLSICGGYQLLGHYYQPFNADKLPGISIIDAYTVAGKKRFIGNVTIDSSKTLDVSPCTLVGFENHSGLTYIGKNAKALGFVTTGNGNNGVDKTEGAVYKHVYGTYLHGSLLPKNPHFADLLITQALSRRYGSVKLTDINNDLEQLTHNDVLNKKY